MKFQKKDLFTIPNILTYVRLICVPVFAWLILDSRVPNNVWWGLGVFLFASVTDVIDGFIARKFNMVSDIGKVLDPLADKLLQITAVITLTLIGYINIAFPIIIVVKEVYMVVGAAIILLFARRRVTIQSNVWGKLATVCLAASVFSAFFHDVFVTNGVYLDVFLFSVTSVLTIIAAVQYTVRIIMEIKRTEPIPEKVDVEVLDPEDIVDTDATSLDDEVIVDVDASDIEHVNND